MVDLVEPIEALTFEDSLAGLQPYLKERVREIGADIRESESPHAGAPYAGVYGSSLKNLEISKGDRKLTIRMAYSKVDFLEFARKPQHLSLVEAGGPWGLMLSTGKHKVLFDHCAKDGWSRWEREDGAWKAEAPDKVLERRG